MDRLVERAEANGWRSVGSIAATWPIVNKIALGRLADLDRLHPSDEHTAAAVLGYHADGAMLRGELVEAAAILSRAQLHLEVSEPHRQRIVVACKQLAALSGGLIDVPVADVPDYDPLGYPGIFQLSHLRHRLIAAYPEARWEVAPPIAEAFTEMRLPVHGRLYEHLVPMLVAAGRADLALPRARDFVAFGARWSAPLFEAVGSLVLSELEADPEAARRALQLAVENRLVLAQIEALELLAVHAHRSGIHDRAALLKASTQAERARRTFLFRWPNRAEVLDEVEVPASVEPVPLERAVEVALRGRGGRGRPALGWSALTPTEVEVATEVAAGATNKEVAARLSMRPSTVKTHLEHIYAKLAVVNRSALASIVTRETPTADG